MDGYDPNSFKILETIGEGAFGNVSKYQFDMFIHYI